MSLTPLSVGDQVEIIAPASRTSIDRLKKIHTLLTSWQLKCMLDENIFGDDLLCSNSDEYRFNALKAALLNPDVKAIICARGGYGSTRLMSALENIPPPKVPKYFLGMSDLTAVNLFLQQNWGWPTLHGGLAADVFSEESIASVKAFLFGEPLLSPLSGKPLNQVASLPQRISGEIIGGNLSLVQTSIGTPWQLQGKDKIIFLEEVNERGYRIDRMLTHLHQAKIFAGAKAIIFGDFLKGEEPNGRTIVPEVLARFSTECKMPVGQIPGLGHDKSNHVLPLGIPVSLQLGEEIKLQW